MQSLDHTTMHTRHSLGLDLALHSRGAAKELKNSVFM